MFDYFTASVIPAWLALLPTLIITSALPRGISVGTVALIWITPATMYGAAPAYHTFASFPPMVTVTGSAGSGNVVVAGRPLDAAYTQENLPLLLAGMENLLHHIGIARKFGIPVVVAVNRFATDTPAELDTIRKMAIVGISGPKRIWYRFSKKVSWPKHARFFDGHEPAKAWLIAEGF